MENEEILPGVFVQFVLGLLNHHKVNVLSDSCLLFMVVLSAVIEIFQYLGPFVYCSSPLGILRAVQTDENPFDQSSVYGKFLNHVSDAVYTFMSGNHLGEGLVNCYFDLLSLGCVAQLLQDFTEFGNVFLSHLGVLRL